MKVSLAAVLFPEAAAQWLETRKAYLSDVTYRDYSIYVKTLGAHFGPLRLPEVTGDDIRAYQKMRMLKVGASQINKECSVLQQMLKRAGLWTQLAPDYQPLPLPKGERGRALSDSEYLRLFRTAQANPNWEAAYLFAVISVNTSAGPKETRTLRLKDVDLAGRTIYIHEGKNQYRVRQIPLNQEAYQATCRALERARCLGARLPEDYLFPFCVKRNCWDPARSQTTFRKAWREIVAAAELPGFRMYDLRHTAITNILQSPEVSEETAKSIAGHISVRMLQHYSHVRLEAKRKAVEAIRWKSPAKRA